MTVLVTAASKHEATNEIAEALVRELRERGVDAEVLGLEEVVDPAAYEAVLLGSGVYMGRWLKETRDCGDDDGCVVADRRVGGRRMVRTAMAYDEALADRVRETLGPRPDLTERKMFGGLCLMAGGHMFCGILGGELMLRLGPDAAETALARPHVRAMDFTGRPLKGMVYVEPGGFRGEQSLRGWLDLALGFVATLPPK